MNALDATRAWLRAQCPLIDKTDRFNANYLGSQATEYTLCTAGETHREDILGIDHAIYKLTFVAQLPYGAALKGNIAAADFSLTWPTGSGVQSVRTIIHRLLVMKWKNRSQQRWYFN